MKTAPHQRLVMVGDRDGLKELLRRRLVECGWRDQVKLICKDLIKEHGHDITYDKLLSMVTTKARTLVPDSVKKELLQKIKNQLIAQEEKLKIKYKKKLMLLGNCQQRSVQTDSQIIGTMLKMLSKKCISTNQPSADNGRTIRKIRNGAAISEGNDDRDTMSN